MAQLEMCRDRNITEDRDRRCIKNKINSRIENMFFDKVYKI